MGSLRLILGDQLSHSISSLEGYDPEEDLVMMCEVHQEATYVKHHKKKIAFIFSAMRHFAEELRCSGYNVAYTTIDDNQNAGSLRGEVERVVQRQRIDEIVVTHPGEHRVRADIKAWQDDFGIPVSMTPDHRFLCTPQEFAQWTSGRKQLRMEYFYREMRKRYSILMDGEKPMGGQWNFDAENRKSPKKGLDIPKPYINEVDDISRDVIAVVGEYYPDHFGDLEPFNFAVTRAEALEVLELFIEERLTCFGDYQDGMIEGEPWMYHSHISFYLNCGLLLPLECARAAEEAYRQGKAPLNSVEGFIRQIIGWREYVRGVYWLNMPQYAEENYFSAARDLPDFFWSADTPMNCLRQCIVETRENAYAHHIQRLMVLGNFLLLTGVDPKKANEWYLLVYADAFEWVELPNVSGMALFADGGYLASKPYAAGGSYINKMSNYCTNCRYKVAERVGPEACPFNYLYWDFLDRNRNKLASNRRMVMMYKTYDRMKEDKKQAIRDDSRKFLDNLM